MTFSRKEKRKDTILVDGSNKIYQSEENVWVYKCKLCPLVEFPKFEEITRYYEDSCRIPLCLR